jgi:hypothetical protein
LCLLLLLLPLLSGDGGMVAAFEGLTVLEGTANNIKEAWRRCD